MIAAMARRIALLFDGTWQSLSQAAPTNIARLARAIDANGAGGCSQIVWYDPGVGAEPASGRRRAGGGLFGRGLDRGLFDAYRFLALNAEPEDAIFIFGFSRGAWAARSLAGWLGARGLVRRGQAGQIAASWRAYRTGPAASGSAQRESNAARAVAFLGCFDTVGQLGVPDLWPGVPLDLALNRNRRFHNLVVGAHVACARHACALDETRRSFPLTPMDRSCATEDIQQRWFIGDHGAVGGGDARHRALSDIALSWMAGQAEAQGLRVRISALDLRPDPLAALHAPQGLLAWLGRAPRTLAPNAWPDRIDPSVTLRMGSDLDYRPAALSP